MERILFFCVFFLSLTLCAQDEKQFFFKDFNWRMDFPAGFHGLSDSETKALREKGEIAIEDTFGTDIEPETKVILSLRSDQSNYLEANYQPYDPVKDGDYGQIVNFVRDMLVETFQKNMKDVIITSNIAHEKIDGLDFYVTDITVTLKNKMELKSLLYSRLFGTKDFSLNMVYLNPERGKQMLKVWRKSSFH